MLQYVISLILLFVYKSEHKLINKNFKLTHFLFPSRQIHTTHWPSRQHDDMRLLSLSQISPSPQQFVYVSRKIWRTQPRVYEVFLWPASGRQSGRLRCTC